MFGGHCIKHWSSTQAIIALSSGEAEYYGLVKAASAGLGAVSMYADMGDSLALSIHTDAEAARGIANRLGLGKTRHIDVHLLWVQERVRAQDFEVHRVKGDDNPADIGTKYLDICKIKKFMNIFSLQFADGRAKECPSISYVSLRDRLRLHNIESERYHGRCHIEV